MAQVGLNSGSQWFDPLHCSVICKWLAKTRAAGWWQSQVQNGDLTSNILFPPMFPRHSNIPLVSERLWNLMFICLDNNNKWSQAKQLKKNFKVLLKLQLDGLGRSPGGRHGNPLQYSCRENPHGQRSLVGYSPWGHKELDTTDHLSTAQHIHLNTKNRLYGLTSFSVKGLVLSCSLAVSSQSWAMFCMTHK